MSEEKEIQTGPQEHPGKGEHFFENSKPILFQDKEEAQRRSEKAGSKIDPLRKVAPMRFVGEERTKGTLDLTILKPVPAPHAPGYPEDFIALLLVHDMKYTLTRTGWNQILSGGRF
ncbi:MAG TPA: hypothetical protein DCO77_14115 [Nitrospiraceae bacterium]|nr:hypothetical protein [Nitrospiraceae bacterium]